MFVAPLLLTLSLTASQGNLPVRAQEKKVDVPVGAARPRVAIPARAQLREIAVPIQIAQPPGLPFPGGPGIGGVPIMPGLPGLPGIGVDGPLGGGSSGVQVGGIGDPAVLKAAFIGSTDDDLVTFFRKRTPPAPNKESLATLIKKLAAKDANEAEKAQGELTAIGPAAVPFLRQAANDSDLGEGAVRAKACLANIEGATAAALVTNAARLLVTRKPVGAAGALIGYLPYAEDDLVFQEVEVALIAVTLRNGKPDTEVLKALKDANPARRGAAANALSRAGGTAFHSNIRPLLKDSRPSVRLRAALGLVSAYDAEAIPVLIDLLADLSPSMRLPVESYLTTLAGEWAVAAPRGGDAMSRRLRRDVWAAWWKNVEGTALLEEIRSRTISNEDRSTLEGLIKKLANPSAEVREAASTDIIAMGSKAGPMLRQAVAGEDPRVSAFAVKCLEAIEKEGEGALPGATPRLLALRRPEGTVAALVAYLPFVESAEMESQLIDILAAIGCPAGKPDPILVKALVDPIATRRAGAAAVLCKGNATGQLVALKKLLEDKSPEVVLRTAYGLAFMGENDAIPSLIGLLKDLPLEKAYEVEEFLDRIAGDKAPTDGITTEVASRAKAVESWNKWWKENGKGVELAKLDLNRRELGNFVVAEQYNPAIGRGRVLEVDASGKVRWDARNLEAPYSVQTLRNGNVLVVEQQQRVTERDRSGKVVGMDRYYGNVFYAERMRNGNTFLACRNQIFVIDSKFNQVLTHSYFTNTILAARVFRDGTIGYVSYGGQYVKLDATGKQLSTTNMNWINRSAGGADVLADGRVVLADQSRNAVVEFAADGTQAWECNNIPVPTNPVKMANGHTLVVSNGSQPTAAIYEIDRQGKIVKKWENLSYRPFRVVRR